MRNYLILILCAVFTWSCTNQPEGSADENIDKAEVIKDDPTTVTNDEPSNERFKVVAEATDKNTKVYTFNNGVVLHSKPDKAGKNLGELPIGTEVTILKSAKVKGTEEGFETEWLEVQVGDKWGFIWGGHLSTIALEANINKTPELEKVLLSNKTVDPTIKGSDNNRYTIKVLQENGEGAELRQDVYAGLSFKTISFKKLEHFSPPLFAIELNYDYTGEVSGKYLEYLTFNKKNSLKSIFKSYLTQQEEGYPCTQTPIYPSDEGGEKNKIILKQECCETGGTACDKEEFIYAWNGKTLSRGN